MKKMYLAAAGSAFAAVMMFMSAASAAPLPGGNPNCVVNWVGGACGPLLDTNQQGTTYCPTLERNIRDDGNCPSCGRENSKA